MRLYSYFASQIDFLKNDCVLLLGLNSERKLTPGDLSSFYDRLEDVIDMLSDRPLDGYFAKK